MPARVSRRPLLAPAAAAALLLPLLLPLLPAQSSAADEAGAGVFVNELHYDNDGTDTGEAIELAGQAGTDLGAYELVLYNGANGEVYDTRALSGALPDQQDGMGTAVVQYDPNGIQNGPGDGIALVHGDEVVQFLSYEGTLTAEGGPAAGTESTDIGVQEGPSTPVGHSLQLTGTGAAYGDFSWAEDPAPATFGEINEGQAFGEGSPGNGGGDGPSAACGDDATATYEIQGDGAQSPLLGDRVAVEGVVTAGFLGENEFDGFYVQDVDGDADPSTSDGLFVYDPDADVAAGDAVRVVGTVDEYFGLTQVDEVGAISECGSDTVEPTEVSLPLDDGGRESYEGMLVTIADPLSVSDPYDLHTYGEVLLSAGGVLRTPTDVAEPGAPQEAVREANERRSLLLDDGQSNQLNRPPYPQPPYLRDGGTLRRGDTVEGLTGVLSYGFDEYRLQPTQPVDVARDGERPASPEDVGGAISVASYNVLNYFTTIDHPDQDYDEARGADSAEEFRRQEDKIVAGILGLGADVVAVQEIEDEVASGAEPPPVKVLADALNDAAEEGTWSAVGLPDNYESNNPIRNGILYRSDRVDPVGGSVAGSDPVWSEDRQPVAQTFDAGGEVFTVVSNHFKSKGGCPDSGGNADQGDGQSCWNARRVAMSQALLDFVDELAGHSGDDDVLAVGDFNSYTEEDPVSVLEDGGLTNLGPAHDEAPYSYVYFGAQGALDHAFATPSLAERVTGADAWHINADEPRGLDYHNEELRPDDFYHTPNQPGLYQEGPYRSSDHDPLLVGFCPSDPPQAEVEVDPDRLWPPDGRYVEVTATVTVESPDEDVSVSLESVESDEPDTGPGYGNRADDIVIEDDTHVQLRAERGGRGDGRAYTLTYEVTDSCGNTTRAGATAEVPKQPAHPGPGVRP